MFNVTLLFFAAALGNSTPSRVPASHFSNQALSARPLWHMRASPALLQTRSSLEAPSQHISSRGPVGRALRAAAQLRHIDFLAAYSRPRTLKEYLAFFELMNAPAPSLVRILQNNTRNSEAYRLAIRALELNHNLLDYPLLRAAYEELADRRDPKAEDLRHVLRHIQYNAVLLPNEGDGLFSLINRRTWPGRSRLLDAYVIAAVDLLRETFTNGDLRVADWAVSDGVTSLELANLVEDLRIRAFDKAFFLWFVTGPEPDQRLAFNSDGRLIQAIFPTKRGPRLWIRTTLANYLPLPLRALVLAGLRSMAGIRSLAHFPGLLQWERIFNHLRHTPRSDFTLNRISLIDPQAERLSTQRPGRLGFIEGDIFNPPAPRHAYHLIRVMGLLMRHDPYFSEAKIREALGRLGADLQEGGVILNGIVSPEGPFLDTYRRRGHQLVREPQLSVGYNHSAPWEIIPIIQRPRFSNPRHNTSLFAAAA